MRLNSLSVCGKKYGESNTPTRRPKRILLPAQSKLSVGLFVRRVAWLGLLVLPFPASVATAQEEYRPLLPLKTEVPPVIDGVLDDAVWQKAPRETGFKTWSPDIGRDMREKTEVYYAYDRENLFFAFRGFDSQPDKIKAAVSSRDNIRSDDYVGINLDYFHDHQAHHGFYVNPLGIQGDYRYTTGGMDWGYDTVWYSAGRIDSEGFTVEIRIPFKSIRFSRKEPVEMAVSFERKITRYSESATYPPADPKKGTQFLIQASPFLLSEIKHYTVFELLPAVTFSRRSFDQDGRLVSEGNKDDYSLTTKYGISSQLILDGTYNPDFSQVETDEAQVDFNQRFALFYPEKRPFFLEGKDIFNFSGHTSGDFLREIVHTRTMVDPLVGVKLSGKIYDRNMLASIYALDELPEVDGERDNEHVAIFRYMRTLSGDNFVGGILTSREAKDSFNRVGGVDGRFRFSQSGAFGFHGFMSQDKTDSQTGRQLGRALGLDYNRNTRSGTMRLAFQDISGNFRTRTGYVTRTGVTLFKARIQRMLHLESKVLRRIDPIFDTTQIRDSASGKYETSDAFNLRFTLSKNSNMQFGYTYSTEIFRGEKFRTSGPSFSGSSQLSKAVYFSLSYKHTGKIRYASNPFQGYGNDVSGSFTYQPSENLRFDSNLTYSDFYRSSDARKLYDYTIIRVKNTYQMNKYLFFRAIVEYDSFYRTALTDFLASFTYIPGTAVHFGYGSLYEKLNQMEENVTEGYGFRETKRSFFFKASYLWRL